MFKMFFLQLINQCWGVGADGAEIIWDLEPEINF